MDGNLFTWKSKKQSTIACSISEVKHHVMAHTFGKLTWPKTLLLKLGLSHSDPMKIFYDNQSAIYIAANPFFYERTKYIEADCHFVHNVVLEKLGTTSFVCSADWTTIIFTKALSKQSFQSSCFKMGLQDLYTPTWESVLRLSYLYYVILFHF